VEAEAEAVATIAMLAALVALEQRACQEQFFFTTKNDLRNI
jgi:hypothetical protein